MLQRMRHITATGMLDELSRREKPAMAHTHTLSSPAPIPVWEIHWARVLLSIPKAYLPTYSSWFRLLQHYQLLVSPMGSPLQRQQTRLISLLGWLHVSDHSDWEESGRWQVSSFSISIHSCNGKTKSGATLSPPSIKAPAVEFAAAWLERVATMFGYVDAALEGRAAVFKHVATMLENVAAKYVAAML